MSFLLNINIWLKNRMCVCVLCYIPYKYYILNKMVLFTNYRIIVKEELSAMQSVQERSAQHKASQISSINGREVYEDPPITREILAIDSTWENVIIFL